MNDLHAAAEFAEKALDTREIGIPIAVRIVAHEHTGEQLLDAAQIPADVHPEEVRTLGNYAVAIRWSDGHASGIFAWDYLKSLADR